MLAAIVSVTCFATPAHADILSDIASFFGFAPRAVVENTGKTADADTKETYNDKLGATESTAATGRVWTDKSVYSDSVTFKGDVGQKEFTTNENDGEEFLVSYSALATSEQITGQANVPVDVVFSIDNSRSMDRDVDNTSNQSRLEATIAAVNTSIETIMAANPQSRVAIVVYGNSAQTVMSLGVPTKMNNGKYISLTTGGSGQQSWSRFTTASGSTSQITERGTNMHMGIDQALNILASASDTHITVNGKQITRQPVMMLLSDGAATSAGSGNWFNPTGEDGDGTYYKYSFALKAMMDASYKKQLVEEHYGLSSAEYHTKIYTIGMGIEQINHSPNSGDLHKYNRAKVALDPEHFLDADNEQAKAIRDLWNGYQNAQDTYTTTEAADNNRSYTLRLPKPTTGADITSLNYTDGYYGAESAADVADVFTKLTEDILTSTPKVPTEITGSNPGQTGWITYTDPIGDYMELKAVKGLIYGGKVYENPTKSEENGTTTYTFNKQVDSPVYGKQDLSQIKITVTKDKGTGKEKLTVAVPAAVIPLRVNEVSLDADGNPETHTATGQYPMRLIYSVGFQDDVLMDAADGSGKKTVDFQKNDSSYIANHKANDGTVWFYSNEYTKTDPGHADCGDAAVTFKPATTNPFYFVQERVPLYTAKNVDNPASAEKFNDGTNGTSDQTYYYQVTYYQGNKEVTEWRSRKGSQLSTVTGADTDEQERFGVERDAETDQWYIKAGTPRLASLSQFDGEKNDKTITGTASLYYHPEFQGDSIEEGEFVVHLGNNGRVGVEQPGTLAVTKTATLAAGTKGPVDQNGNSTLDDQEFTFTPTFTKDGATVTHAYRAEKRKGDAVVGANLTVKSGETFTLKNGETLYIYDLEDGVHYSVSETNMPDGFTQVEPSDNAAASGDIKAGETVNAAFKNEYQVTPTTVNNAIPFQKHFDGWDNNPGLTFEFWLVDMSEQQNNPLPKQQPDGVTSQNHRYVAVKNIGDEKQHNFGNITFSKSGTYEYVVYERTPDDAAKWIGVDFSNELYNVTVTVDDNGDGTLTPTVKMVKGTDTGTGAGPEVNLAEFTNTYTLDNVHLGAVAQKNYTDKTGGNPLTENKFKFHMQAVGANAGTAPKVYKSSELNAEEIQPDGNGVYTFYNALDGSISLGQIRFEKKHANIPYVFKVWEDTTGDADADGMTYDKTVYYAHVVAEPTNLVDENGKPVLDDNGVQKEGLVVKVTFRASEDANSTEVDVPGNRPVFTNTYEAKETTGTVAVQKTLLGRDWKNGESYGFTLTPASDDAAYTEGTGDSAKKVSTAEALTAGKIVFPENATSLQTSVTAPAQLSGSKGVAQSGAFSAITFKRAGTYTFNVVESEFTEGEHASVERDAHTVQVKITVTDNKSGQLSVTKTEYVQGNSVTDADKGVDDAAAFTNKYTSSMTYGSLRVKKTMTGAVLHENDFTFTVKGSEGSNAINETLKTHNHFFDPATCTMTVGKKLSFTQDDAEKTFTYTVSEQVPSASEDEDANKPGIQKDGVTYDQNNTYTVEVVPHDNGDGIMYTITTVKDANGSVKATFDSRNANQANPTVEFNNSYEVTPSKIDTSTTPGFAKELTGRSWDGISFKFTLTALDGAPLPAGNNDAVLGKDGKSLTVTIDNAEKAKSFGFGTITITQADMANADINQNTGQKKKQFKYTIKEDAPATDANGMKYDRGVRTLTLTVTDDGSGKLTVTHTVTVDGQALGSGGTFKNSYETTVNISEKGGLNVAKELTGHDIAQGQFTFKAKAVKSSTDGADTSAKKFGLTTEYQDVSETLPVAKMDGDRKATSSFAWLKDNDIVFTQADAGHTYSLLIKENAPDSDGNGYKYDRNEKQIDFVVTDDFNGKLTVTVKQGETTLGVYTNGESQTVPTVTFSNSYSAKGELIGATDLKGTKTVKSVNSTYPGSLAGFEFTIKQVDESGNEVADASVTLPKKATSDKKGEFAFGNITFTQPGVYYFQVSEVKGNAPGMTYDTTPRTIKVTVEEENTGNGNGVLKVTKVENESGKLAFENTYTSGTIDHPISVTKTVVGHDALEEFKFTLSAENKDAQGAIDSGKITGAGFAANKHEVTLGTGDTLLTNNQSNKIDFGTLTFKQAGTYVFKVVEENAKSNVPTNWTYDNHEYEVTVVVTDTNAVLSKVVTVEGDATFTNRFGTTTTYGNLGGMQVTKKLTGRDLVENQFSFTIAATANADNYDEAAAKLDALKDAAGKNENTSFTNGAPGTDNTAVMQKLSGLAFDQNDIGKTFTYTVTEVDTSKDMPGYNFDQNLEATVVITIGEKGGELTATTVVTKGGEQKTYANGETAVVPFENSYSAKGSLTITASKTLTGRKMEGGEFHFGIVAKGDKTDGTADVTTGTNSAEGVIIFDAINYTAADLDKLAVERPSYVKEIKTEDGKRAWTINYTAYEKTPLPAGVTAKTDPIDFTVTVVDNGSGTLSLADDSPDKNLVFENTYGGDSATATIRGKKVLAGDPANTKPDIAGEYTFTIKNGDGSDIKSVNDDFKNEAKNDKEGNVTFPGKLVYTMEDLAEGATAGENGVRTKDFTYKVTENGDVPGVTNDSVNPKTVTIRLTDNGQGELKAEVLKDNEGNAFRFTNTYEPTAAEHTPVVTKMLEGRTPGLQAEEFTFEMSVAAKDNSPKDGFAYSKDAEGNNLTTAKNDKDGKVTFQPITFSKEGTYTVTINEQVPVDGDKAPYMEYDGHTYTYDVVVTSDGSGQLKAEVKNASTDDGGSTFTNKYNPPEDTKDVVSTDKPETSIDGQLVGVGSKLTYKVNWVNDAVDATTGKSVPATVTVTDTVPAGTKLVNANGATESKDDKGNTVLTWSINAAAGANGTVSFDVEVTEDAVNYDDVSNTATIKIGDHSKTTNTTHNDFPKKSVATEKPEVESDIQVGDKLTYTIEWANHTGKEADVVITDVLSDGLTFVSASDGGEFDKDSKTVTWNLGKKADGKSGKVTVTVQVNENAVKPDANNGNKATINVGNSGDVTTNTVPGPQLETGALTVTKTVTAQDGVINKNQAFAFTVTATDKAGNKLNGAYGDATFANGVATFELKHGESKNITGLPEGAKYTVTEAKAAGYTTTKTGDTGTIKANETATAAFTNAYSSTVPGNKPVTVDGLFSKTFTGRTWNAGDEFTFKIVGVNPETGAELDANAQPMPEKNEVTVAGDSKADVTSKDIDFGKINFTFDDIKGEKPNADGVREKKFCYDVYEVVPGDDARIPGVRYDEHHAHLTITLTDDGKGELSADRQLVATKSVAGGEFHNVYTTDVDYTAMAGIQLQKTLTGRDMTDGQFAFTLGNFSEGAAKKLGLNEGKEAYAVKAAKAGEASTIDLFAGKTLEFTDKDAGKTYSFDVTETKVGGDGYTNDTAVRHVKIEVTYNEADGLLTVTTTVTKDGVAEPVAQTVVTSKTAAADHQVATIPFNNSYEATTENPGGATATIEATKSLTGRPLEDGEFAFTLTGPGLDAAGKTVRNQGDKVPFGTFNYKASDLEAMVDGEAVKRITTEDGKRGWELSYTASEATEGFSSKGLTANRQSFPATVTVVDNGDGSLVASVAYPAEAEGGNVFQNTYNAGEATLSLSGKKVLDHADGLKPNSIEGKFTFTLTDEAGNKLATAKNDANGNVSFGNVLKYTLDDFNNGADASEGEGAQDEADATNEGIDAQAAPRELTYTYYVEETGSASGVTNDATAKKAIQVKVKDDGEGHLTAAVVKDDKALDFTFTNTYKVQPVSSSITDQLSIGKTIDGREMQAGEFVFEMLENGKQVVTGKNTEAGASSKVVFDAITFAEPGEHDYTVREVDNGKGGVGYDSVSYQAHASVKDNGDGTLSVTWTISKGDKPVTEGIVFNNTYEAKPTSLAFNAAKVLTGRDLKAGEFTFQLRENGKVLQTVKNGVDGDAAAIKFDAIAYDKAGEHDYEIVEVKGDDATITYDETVFTYHVSVTDDGNGSLKATWTVGESGDPVFQNVYTEPPTPEPPTPETPEDPGEPELPQTGDRMPATGVLATIAAFGAALVGGGVALIKRRR